MMIGKRNLSSMKNGNARVTTAVRYFAESRAPTEITEGDLLDKDLLKIERFRKWNQKSILPTSMTDVMGLPDTAGLPKNLSELSVFNGMPSEHAKRVVTIAPRPLKTMQSGNANAHLWEITWAAKEYWSNPLMGWTSSADPLSTLTLTFNDVEGAIHFAQKQGWKYHVSNPTSKFVVEPGTFNYMQNFLPKRTMELVKEQGIKKNVVFKNSAYGASHWFPAVTYHGDGLVEQHGPRAQKGK